jgi:hypothetical protein
MTDPQIHTERQCRRGASGSVSSDPWLYLPDVLSTTDTEACERSAGRLGQSGLRIVRMLLQPAGEQSCRRDELPISRLLDASGQTRDHRGTAEPISSRRHTSTQNDSAAHEEHDPQKSLTYRAAPAKRPGPGRGNGRQDQIHHMAKLVAPLVALRGRRRPHPTACVIYRASESKAVGSRHAGSARKSMTLTAPMG